MNRAITVPHLVQGAPDDVSCAGTRRGGVGGAFATDRETPTNGGTVPAYLVEIGGVSRTKRGWGRATAGDPLGFPQDASGAHGINNDRITAVMHGYLDGVEACGLSRRKRRLTLSPVGVE